MIVRILYAKWDVNIKWKLMDVSKKGEVEDGNSAETRG